MQLLATRLDEAGRGEEAEYWLRRAAEAGGMFARLALIRLISRLDQAADVRSTRLMPGSHRVHI
jgi:hypothetical protein